MCSSPDETDSRRDVRILRNIALHYAMSVIIGAGKFAGVSMSTVILPEKSDAARFRAFLTESGYSEQALIASLGRARPPAEGQLHTLLHLTRKPNAINALVRLFLVGSDLESALAEEVLPGWLIEFGIDTKIFQHDRDRLLANIVIVPTGDFLVASDAFRVLGTDKAEEFVLPASTHSAGYLRQLMISERVERSLDLGCGCGIHALTASLHSAQVIASDISERAILFTTFNAILNRRDNIECVTGDGFAALGDQKFDQIISNPTFFPGPGSAYTCRDNRLELDEFCRLLVSDSAKHLNDGGHLQMLCEWVEIEGEPWQERLKSWVHGTDCDTWLLHSPPVLPAIYASKRLTDIQGETTAQDRGYDEWLEYFASRNVVAIHPGMIVLRKRRGDNWFHVHDLATALTGDSGEAVRRGIIANDFLSRADDAALLDATLSLSPHLVLEQRYSRTDNQWQPEMSALNMSDGMPMEAEVDMPVMALLNQLDGSRSLGECITRFAEAASVDEGKIQDDFLPIVRLFVGRGFLTPPE